MKNKITMCLVVGGLLALAAGCGKTENAAPPAKEAEKTTSAPKAEPTPTAETLVAQATNAAAATTDPAKTTLDTAAKAAETAMTPVKEATPPAVAATNAAPDKPQGAVSQAQTTLAGLSQDQMVQGLKDALARGLQQAIAGLGHDGGFLTNLNVKIPMPEKLQTAEKALRAMKQDKLADDFVTTMNHAAEQAVPESAARQATARSAAKSSCEVLFMCAAMLANLKQSIPHLLGCKRSYLPTPQEGTAHTPAADSSR